MKRLFRLLFALLIGVIELAHAQCSNDGFIMPTSGTVSSVVGMRNGEMHEGLDIAGSVGTPVVAAGGGVVTVRNAGGTGPGTGYDPEGYGDYVYIRHPNGTYTLYGHLDSINVREGQSVSQGQQIGTLGNTGGSTGPHLHFEVSNAPLGTPLRVNGNYWDTAAGITDNAGVSRGSCINMNAGPGGDVAGDPGSPADENGNPTTGTGGPNDASDGVDPNAPALPDPVFDPENIDLETILPTPKEWIEATLKVMEEFGLAKHLNTLGFVLLFVGFVYSLANATYFYRSDQYFSLLGRLIIAAGLIWGSPNIAAKGLEMWESIHNNMQEAVVTPAVDDLEEHINEFAPLVRDWAVITGTLTALAAIVPEPFGIDVLSPARDMSKEFTMSLFTVTVLMGSVYGIFFLMIYVSALMMILAGAFMPVLSAFLVLPGMVSWFSRWFSMIVLSLTLIVASAFMFRVVVDLGVSKPIQKMSEIAEGAKEQIDYLEGVAANHPGFTLWINDWADYLGKLVSASLTVMNNLVQIFIQWVFGLLLLAISVLASIYIMQQLPRLLAGLIGSVAGSAANAVSGGAIAGLAIGGATAMTGGQAASALGGAAATAAAKTAAAAHMAIRPSTQPGGSRPALPPGKEGSSGGNTPSSSSGASSSGASSSGNVQRGNFQNDSSAKTVNTTATGGRTNPRG